MGLTAAEEVGTSETGAVLVDTITWGGLVVVERGAPRGEEEGGETTPLRMFSTVCEIDWVLERSTVIMFNGMCGNMLCTCSA